MKEKQLSNMKTAKIVLIENDDDLLRLCREKFGCDLHLFTAAGLNVDTKARDYTEAGTVDEWKTWISNKRSINCIDQFRRFWNARVRFQIIWHQLLKWLDSQIKNPKIIAILFYTRHSKGISVTKIDLTSSKQVQIVKNFEKIIVEATSRMKRKRNEYASGCKFDLSWAAPEYFGGLGTNLRSRLLIFDIWARMKKIPYSTTPGSYFAEILTKPLRVQKNYWSRRLDGIEKDKSCLSLSKLESLYSDLSIRPKTNNSFITLENLVTKIIDGIDNGSCKLSLSIADKIDQLLPANRPLFYDSKEKTVKVLNKLGNTVEKSLLSYIRDCLNKTTLICDNLVVQEISQRLFDRLHSIKSTKNGKKALTVPLRGQKRSEYGLAEVAEQIMRSGAILNIHSTELGPTALFLKELYLDSFQRRNKSTWGGWYFDDTSSIGHISNTRYDGGLYIVDQIYSFRNCITDDCVYLFLQDKIPLDENGWGDQNVIKEDFIKTNDLLANGPKVSWYLPSEETNFFKGLLANLNRIERRRMTRKIAKDFENGHVVAKFGVFRWMDITELNGVKNLRIHAEIFHSTGFNLLEVLETLRSNEIIPEKQILQIEQRIENLEISGEIIWGRTVWTEAFTERGKMIHRNPDEILRSINSMLKRLEKKIMKSSKSPRSIEFLYTAA